MGRADQAAETRRRILEAARQQFEAEGYDRPTIRSIAAQAGVAAGTVMLHFTDKPGLLGAALADQIDEALAEMEALAAADGAVPAGRRLAGLVMPLYRRYFQRPALARVLVAGNLFPGTAGPQQARQEEQIGRLRRQAAACAGLGEDDPRLALFLSAYLTVLIRCLRAPTPEAETAGQMLDSLLARIEGFS